ncbi:class E sortase [Nocardioides sp.]|uniref:class E sortase n=1 Tax=Nocardioides sp. TaxID=35761 RepID=UPI00271DC4DA|nr:class E sortase [Nocardioides sp.]MDO9454622.1 class E sortase [Nocardioides sp.]
MTGVQDDEPEAAPRRRARRRGWTFWLGLGLVLAGLSILGWIGWQLYGTNLVSQRRHEETVDRLEKEWAEPQGQPDVETAQGKAYAILRIPALGEDFAVPVLEGVEDDALASGIGHFETSAAPGEVGNYALAGHRVTHGEPLRDMPDLDAGDEVVVETRDVVYTYVLDTGGQQLRVPFTSGWVVDPAPVNPDGGVGPAPDQDRLITLTTCAELFHTDDRLVAFGHLTSAVER